MGLNSKHCHNYNHNTATPFSVFNWTSSKITTFIKEVRIELQGSTGLRVHDDYYDTRRVNTFFTWVGKFHNIKDKRQNNIFCYLSTLKVRVGVYTACIQKHKTDGRSKLRPCKQYRTTCFITSVGFCHRKKY